MQPRDGLVPKKGADALDRPEILAMLHGPDTASVQEGLVHRKIEPVAGNLHAGAVERTRPPSDGDPAAARAAESLVIDAVLEEQQIDPRI